MPRPFRPGLFFAVLTFVLGTTASRAETVFADHFDDGDPRLADSQPHFWTILQQEGNLDSSATEHAGSLRLRAGTWANSHVSMVSQPLEDFGFFSRSVTFTLDDLALEVKGIPDADARFKLSLSASPERAERAADVLSLRIRPGLLLLGYRVDGFALGSGPETLSGNRETSVLVQELSALPTKLSLTLGPAQKPGHIRFEIVAEGDGVSVLRSGVIPLSLATWGNTDSASLGLDARRDSGSAGAGTYTELRVGKITVTR